MADPVTLSDGHTFERHAIEAHLARSKTNPMTNAALDDDATLSPNRALRDAIAAWLLARTRVGEASAFVLPAADLSFDMTKTLGLGGYGHPVCRGTWKGQSVAVTSVPRPLFYIDPALLAQAGRLPHMAKFFGVVPATEAAYVVTELVPHHTPLDRWLMTYADDGRPLPAMALLTIAVQVATAMAGLADLGVVHGNLAARNVLVVRLDPANPADTLVKLTGLNCAADDAAYYSYRGATLVPVRCMAPEAIKRMRVTTASDVWAFGVLLWELFSACEFPYRGVSDADLLAHVDAGNRLPRPVACPPALYEGVMLRCWAATPAMRPTFGDLLELLGRLRL
jgi:serine/threonine protein kinase